MLQTNQTTVILFFDYSIVISYRLSDFASLPQRIILGIAVELLNRYRCNSAVSSHYQNCLRSTQSAKSPLHTLKHLSHNRPVKFLQQLTRQRSLPDNFPNSSTIQNWSVMFDMPRWLLWGSWELLEIQCPQWSTGSNCSSMAAIKMGLRQALT